MKNATYILEYPYSEYTLKKDDLDKEILPEEILADCFYQKPLHKLRAKNSYVK